MSDDAIQPEFHGTMNQVAAALDDCFNGKPQPGRKKQVGFVLLTFNFGDNAHVNYISNADRKDMIAAMKEFIARAEGMYFGKGGNG